jgi:hypothetical protein
MIHADVFWQVIRNQIKEFAVSFAHAEAIM